jgi:hypothetical protein
MLSPKFQVFKGKNGASSVLQNSEGLELER